VVAITKKMISLVVTCMDNNLHAYTMHDCRFLHDNHIAEIREATFVGLNSLREL
jgi:hypothetical protein